MSPGLSAPKASPVSASHSAPSRAPRHSPHPRDLYSQILGLLRPPSVSRTGDLSLLSLQLTYWVIRHAFPRIKEDPRGEKWRHSCFSHWGPLGTQLLPRLHPSLHFLVLPLALWLSSGSASVVTVVLTYPTAENMGTRGMLTPGWGGCKALGGLWGPWASPPSFLYALCLEGRNPRSCDLGRPSGRCSHFCSWWPFFWLLGWDRWVTIPIPDRVAHLTKPPTVLDLLLSSNLWTSSHPHQVYMFDAA